MEINLETNAAQADAAIRDGDTQKAAAVPADVSELKSVIEPQRNITAAINDMLLSYGLKLTPENIKMTMLLLANELPVTADNLKLTNQALKLFGDDDAKIAFFIENQIKINTKNVELLQGFAEHKALIGNLLSDLFDSVLAIKDGPLKNQILTELLGFKTEGAVGFTPPEQNTAQAQAKPDIAQGIIKPDIAQEIVKPGIMQEIIKPDIAQEIIKPDAPAQQTDIKPQQTDVKPPQAPQAPQTTDTPQLFQKILSAASNAQELEVIKDALIKANPSFKAQITEMSVVRSRELSDSPPPANRAAATAANADTPAQIHSREEVFKQIIRAFPEDTALREKILESFNLKGNAPVKELLFSKFSLSPANLTKDEFNALIKNINEALNEIVTKHSADEQMARPLAQAAEIRDALSFLSHIKNDVFIQIPLIINDNKTTGELYVFRDKKRKNITGRELSALIALDTENLGRFETYIVKQGAGVNLQFRLETAEYEGLVKDSIHTLNDALNSKGLYINGVSYKKLDESFSLLNREPADGKDDIKAPFDYTIFDRRM